jgi:hypothetical protein
MTKTTVISVAYVGNSMSAMEASAAINSMEAAAGGEQRLSAFIGGWSE